MVNYIKLESYIFNNSLTLQDSDFVDSVTSDIRCFVENLSKKRVLVFPPFSSFRRYLVHQIVEIQFENLKTFSIGEGDNRRTVVCFNEDYKSTPDLPSNVCPSIRPNTKIADTGKLAESTTDSGQEGRKRVKRTQTMPSVSIYRPPAARKLEQNVNLSNIQSGEMGGTSSPGKNKFRNSEEPKEITGKRNENDGMSVFRSAITSIRTQNKVPKCKNVESANKKIEPEAKVSKPEQKSINQNKQRRPDMQVYVPKGRRSANGNSDSQKLSSPVREEKSCRKPEVVLAERNYSQVDCTESKKDANDREPGTVVPETKVSSEASEPKVTPEPTDTSLQKGRKLTSCSESSEKTDESTVNNSHGEKVSERENTKTKVSNLNPEEDDWETMYDDTGECLDPSLLDQLTSAVGEVTIEKPKSSYNGYKTKSLDTVADEFPHVIEIYNFPPEFQLQDLMMVFSQFKNSGFEIKWVDDTHALGIFSSSAIVSEVLDFYHPFVKTRSLKDGTLLSKMKARRSAEFLLPYKPRPETCSALARRLVTGALGVRLPTSRQEREVEKQILKKAREKKRLEAKQKEDAWEGTFS